MCINFIIYILIKISLFLFLQIQTVVLKLKDGGMNFGGISLYWGQLCLPFWR